MKTPDNNKKRTVKGPIKYLYITIGIISLAVGVIAVILPLLPHTPFFVLTLVCFAKGSERLHNWFLSTQLYKKHLESYLKNRTMTRKTKISIICSITLFMGFAAFMMRNIPIGLAVLAVVWVGHILYFIFRVKTDEDCVSVKNDE